jgi:hypothetical protein
MRCHSVLLKFLKQDAAQNGGRILFVWKEAHCATLSKSSFKHRWRWFHVLR